MNVFAFLVHRVTPSFLYCVDKLMADDRTLIIVHVDKKAEISEFLGMQSESLIFIEDREDVCWGGFEMILATLRLMREAQKYEFNYFTLLSGDDIPIVKADFINDFFDSAKKEFIAFQNERQKPVCPDKRVRYEYASFNFKKNRALKDVISIVLERGLQRLGFMQNRYFRYLPTLYKGSQWFSLSSGVVKYIFEYIDENPEYPVAFERSLCSDEIFFHTIIGNSKFKESITDSVESAIPLKALRYIDWSTGPDLPRTLDESDFQKIGESRAFFARKMATSITVECLKENFG